MSPRTSLQNKEIRATSIQTITEAAAALFMEFGYLNVTIDQIAKRAGISKGLMYNYFSGKEALLMHIVEQVGAEMAVFEQIMEQEPVPSGKLLGLIRSFFSMMRENADFWQMVIPIITQKGISEKMETALRAMLEMMVTKIEAIFESAGIANPRLEAFQLGALFDGIALAYMYVFRDHYPLDAMEAELLSKYSKLMEHGK